MTPVIKDLLFACPSYPWRQALQCFLHLMCPHLHPNKSSSELFTAIGWLMMLLPKFLLHSLGWRAMLFILVPRKMCVIHCVAFITGASWPTWSLVFSTRTYFGSAFWYLACTSSLEERDSVPHTSYIFITVPFNLWSIVLSLPTILWCYRKKVHIVR